MKKGLLIGAIAGSMLGLLTAVGGSVAYVNKRTADLRRGWVIVPVVIAARPLKRGDRIASGFVRVGESPEQFVTESLVPPASLAALSQRVLAVDLPVNAMVRWADLESEPPDPVRECVRKGPK